jgi:hypothetical protein
LELKCDEKDHTFYLYFSYTFYLIIMYEVILGEGSAVPEALRGEGVRGTRNVEKN